MKKFLLLALLAIGLSGCACDDVFDYCPTNIWTKPV
jgi:hypothetical protein